MKRNKDYDAREEALQDMDEKQKDRAQDDDLSTKENRWPILVFSGLVLVILCGIILSRVLI